jgi:molecular chaperone GrpE
VTVPAERDTQATAPPTGDAVAPTPTEEPAPTEESVTDAAAPAEPEAKEPTGDDDVKAVETDLDELVSRAEERDEYLALAQRTQADFDNYRRRIARDIVSAEGRGVAKLAKSLLPALDNVERALAAADSHADVAPSGEKGLVEGIRLLHSELSAALARNGIESFRPTGERFDPEQHEAMAQHPTEGAESGTVVEVYEPGYRMEGAVIRPARVVVAA